MYQYIVFDLDMTILNTWEANLCAVKEALEKLEGKIVEKKDLEHIFGCTTNQTMENFGVKDKRAFIQEWYDGVVRYQREQMQKHKWMWNVFKWMESLIKLLVLMTFLCQNLILIR